jgi:three-Cys-motif partner protein
MPAKKSETLWDAEPHTIAKISILESYLMVWFQILGRTKHNQDLLYIDGFAGPGQYRNHTKGSPIAALVAAKEALALTGSHWTARNIHCAFIEPDKKSFAHLTETIKPFQDSGRLKIHTYQDSFVGGLSRLKTEAPLLFQNPYPRFVFIDPFGATGAPFSVVREILSSPCSEVLINLDADGIVRILHAKEAADAETLLNEIFGGNLWKGVLSEHKPFNALCFDVLRLYKDILRSLPKIKYIFPFEMRTYADTLNYFLVFAAQHPLGLEKMKEAMKRIDQSGGYCFSDANINQNRLFRFDDVPTYSNLLYEQFRGRIVSYSELRDFALNETPFINPKGLLKELEQRNRIEVASNDPRRRRGTFNEEKIKEIRFS